MTASVKDIETKLRQVEGDLARVLKTVTVLGQKAAPSVIFDFVFAPGHPTPLPANVFATWSDLVTAANHVGGIPYITFDDSFSPVVIPAGMWSFSGRPVFRALAARAYIGPLVKVTVADGAKITGVSEFRDVDIRSVSSSPVISSPAGSTALYFLQGTANLQADGTAPFIEHGVSQQCLLVVDDNASVSSSNSPALHVTVPGDDFTAITWKSGFIDENTIEGVAGRKYGARIAQPDGLVKPKQAVPAFPIAFGAEDQFIQHVPTTTSWATAPNNVNEAIERIAAALVVSTGGKPIP